MLIDIFAEAIAGASKLGFPEDLYDEDGNFIGEPEEELSPEQEAALAEYYAELDQALYENNHPEESEPAERHGKSGHYRQRSPEKREHDRQLCGIVAREKVSGKTGKLTVRRFYCRQWQDGFCPNCAEYRLRNLRERAARGFLKAQDGGQKLLMASMTEAESKGYARQCGKANYYRLPQGNDTVLMFMAVAPDSQFPGTVIDDERDIYNLDWQTLANTKDGNLSGSLGALPSSHEESIEVEIREVILLAPTGIKSQAWLETLTETMDPSFTADELLLPGKLELTVRTRMNLYVSKVVKAGGTLLKDWTVLERIEISSIDWFNIAATDLAKTNLHLLIDGYDELRRAEAALKMLQNAQGTS